MFEREPSRNVVLYQIRTLNEIALASKSRNHGTFTFAHILLPHHSQRIFNGDGTFPTKQQVKSRSVEETYINHLVYANSEIKKLVNNLLLDTDNLPIIILQSDEGRLSTEFYDYMKQKTQDSPMPSNIVRQRAYILTAIYFPRYGTEYLYPSISPVNIFRVIFNRYFNLNYDLLPDKFYFPREYYGSGPGKPSSDFYDATALLK